MRVVENPVFSDDRGFFLEFWKAGGRAESLPDFKPDSVATSFNSRRHTLRGMHFQAPPHEQAKLVFCSHGRAYDVALDLRPESPTYLEWEAEELTPASGKTVYIPRGFAHGFLTLEPNTVMTYLIEGPYAAEAGGIVRWNDPCHGITWPHPDPVLSDRDRHAPDFHP